MQTRGTELAHGRVTGEILKAFFDVYRELGYGFSEVVYRRALGIVLRGNGLTALEEVLIEVRFRGSSIGRFHADLVVERVVLVETKAASEIEPYARAQVLNYLKAAGGGVALLLNFGPEPMYQRFVLGNIETSLPHLQAMYPATPASTPPSRP